MSIGQTGTQPNLQIYNGMPENMLDIRPRVRLTKEFKLVLTFSDAHYHRQTGVYNIWSRMLLRTGLR